MASDSQSAAIVGAIAATVSVLLAKFADFLLHRRTRALEGDATVTVRRIEDSAALRSELWAEIKALRAQISEHSAALKVCQEDVFAAKSAYMAMRAATEAFRERCLLIERALATCDPAICRGAQLALPPLGSLPDLPPWPGFDRPTPDRERHGP